MVKLGPLGLMVVGFVFGIVHCQNLRLGDANSLKIILFEGCSDNYQNELRESLETTQNFFTDDIILGAYGIGAAATIIASGIGTPIAGIIAGFFEFLPILLTTFSQETDWKENFIYLTKNREILNNAKIALQQIDIKWKYRMPNYLNTFNKSNNRIKS